MESISQQMAEMTDMFNHRMNDFQQDLEKSSSTPGSPSSKISSEFHMFRTFVMSALNCLQSQVNLLSQLYDQQEMRSRRKILLVHGISESKGENPGNCVSQILSDQLKMPAVTSDALSRCHRMGVAKEDKPRPMVVKFRDVKLRDQVWQAKTKLKGTSFTLSEFLTKPRHEIFMAARKRFGISKCWTKDGSIFVVDSDGVRHRVSTVADFDNIKTNSSDMAAKSMASTSTKVAVPNSSRSRRAQKLK